MTDTEQHSAAESNPAPQHVIFEESRLMVVLLFMIIPFFVGMDMLFDVIWKNKPPLLDLNVPTWIKYASVLIAIVLHELIHGIVFAFYAPHGFQSVKFGFSRTMWSPYCHCSDPVKVKYYMRAGIAPLVILGLIPLVFGMITGVNWIKVFGLLLTVGGFGDLLVWIKLLKFDKDQMVLDHPTKMGFIIFD